MDGVEFIQAPDSAELQIGLVHVTCTLDDLGIPTITVGYPAVDGYLRIFANTMLVHEEMPDAEKQEQIRQVRQEQEASKNDQEIVQAAVLSRLKATHTQEDVVAIAVEEATKLSAAKVEVTEKEN